MPVRIGVRKLQALCDPFRSRIWGSFTINKAMVRQALSDNTLQPSYRSGSGDPYYHAGRIAWFYLRGWTDAIDVEVGCPALHCYVDWPVQDGNHRLAAAILRGDREIKALVGGDIDYAFDLFGVDVTER